MPFVKKSIKPVLLRTGILSVVFCLIGLTLLQPLGYSDVEWVLSPGELVSTKPDNLKETLKYNKYLMSEYYVVASKGRAQVRATPEVGGQLMTSLLGNDKMAATMLVQGDEVKAGNNIWIKVNYAYKGQRYEGYVYSGVVNFRAFAYDKAVATADAVKKAVDNNRVAYIDNFRGRNGLAPKINGKETIDAFEINQFQSAPAYYEDRTDSEFRYLQDGRLVILQDTQGSRWKVMVPELQETYYVPSKYIRQAKSLKALKQVVVVDRGQQNEMVFEASATGWNLISRQMATTGAQDEFRMPTELGAFLVMNKLERFEYLNDETKKIGGYAPYAIRFNGGAYIHGVPMDYKPDYVPGQPRPEPAEYMSSIGTIPKSHKCVRNYTSHAKFLYDWATVGQTVVIVIE